MSAQSLNEAAYLIQQAAKQDREAFSQIYDRYSSLVFSLAMRMLRARDDAEDLLQEVFVQVWRQAANYSQERGSPEAWIVNIARSRRGGAPRIHSARRRRARRGRRYRPFQAIPRGSFLFMLPLFLTYLVNAECPRAF